MKNTQEGPEILKIEIATCSYCKYNFNSRLWKSGKNPIRKSDCIHPDYPKYGPEIINNETPCECPFLKNRA